MKPDRLKFKPAISSALVAAAAFVFTGACGGSSGGDDASEATDAPDAPDDLDVGEEEEFTGCGGSPTPDFLCNPSPPSTLLPPGTTQIDFFVNSDQPATCGWSVGGDPGYPGMTPFEQGQGTRDHSTTIAGLDPSTIVVNEVYVRCDPRPDFVLHLRYRSLPDADPSFPRTGNLWGWWGLFDQGLEHCARIDLFLGADFDPADLRTLRTLNPDVLVLTSINTVEHAEYEGDDIPDDYYLRDVSGNRFEVWPGAYRLNLTKPEVAEYQARYAYQRILDDDLMVDGCFFDNFFTSQSWQDHDIYGNPIQLDADGNGVEDDPAWLDAAWRDGVFHELRTWRTLMPDAYASGHLPRPPTGEIGAIFNGDSIGFMPADVIEGQRGFPDLWDTYNGWWEVGRRPVITMTEASPPDLIAYGYDYSPLEKIPASTLEFSRNLYPYMRFGLAVTLMNDGYFAYEFGDTWHGNDWWYDELDHDLGRACGPAERVPVGTPSTTDLMTNGSFEEPLEGTWSLWANAEAGAAATATRDTADFADGAASARIDVTSAGEGVDWHINFYQADRALVQGVSYDMRFKARSSAPRTIAVSAQKGAPDWRGYGLWREVALTTGWKEYLVTFEASETASDARVQFFVGAQTGSVWIDGVSVVEHPADVFRRVFSGGMAILNGTRERQTLAVEPGYSRLTGDQAPRYEFLVDDGGAQFTCSAEWAEAAYDSGTWQASGPFYHDWGEGCHRLDGTTGEAQWSLDIQADDTYRIEAWWPAAPESTGWSARAVYEVVAGAAVLASAALEQTSGGDEWHLVAEVALRAADAPFVRIRNEGTGPAIADALYLRSSARYNDGSPASQVVLEPMDGIVLRRDGDPDCP